MANEAIDAKSATAAVAAVHGENTAKVTGAAPAGSGVVGISTGGSVPNLDLFFSGTGVVGCAGFQGTGVFGGATGPGFGIFGHCQPDGIGVFGQSGSGTGVQGTGGKAGVSGSSTDGVGVNGECLGGNSGVLGVSDTGHGVHGTSRTNHAVHGQSAAGRGVVGISETFIGVTGESTSNDGVLGVSASGIGVHGKGGQLAGFFEGELKVAGHITCSGDMRLLNADCAEDFNIAGSVLAEPGTVMVINNHGELGASMRAYDRRVAGVVSGAGEYKPGIILDKRESGGLRQPIALLGKVFCKVDAQFSAINVGDLLTTSPTPGHAMAANDALQAFGAVIGKALRPLKEGQGLIPILICLQ